MGTDQSNSGDLVCDPAGCDVKVWSAWLYTPQHCTEAPRVFCTYFLYIFFVHIFVHIFVQISAAGHSLVALTLPSLGWPDSDTLCALREEVLLLSRVVQLGFGGAARGLSRPAKSKQIG